MDKNWDKIGRVRAIKISNIGDLKIYFENGVIFETFIDTSDKDEEWRLINYKTLKHYVIIEEIDHSI